MQEDRFLPESLTGAYEGMFPKTTGALMSLFLETGRYKEAELNIRCILNVIRDNGMERIPRVIRYCAGFNDPSAVSRAKPHPDCRMLHGRATPVIKSGTRFISVIKRNKRSSKNDECNVL
jgi:hypothetical protein